MMRAVFAVCLRLLLLLSAGDAALAQTSGGPVAVVRGLDRGYERNKPALLET